MTIEIPDDLAVQLQRIAALRHKSVERFALDELRSIAEGSELPPGSPATLLRAVKKPPLLSPSDVDELDAAIASGAIDLRERGIKSEQAADLRRRLTAFAEDWERSEMAAYDELPSR